MVDDAVVVLGSGGAGLRAALELKQAGLDVWVVSKGAADASGATPSGLFSYCTGNPADPANSVERFREDVLRSGLTVNDPLLVDAYSRDGYARLQDLARMGMPWTRSADGEIARAWLPGHSVNRAFHVDWRTGKAMSTTLLRACVKAGVRFSQYEMALDLLVEEGKVKGLVMLNWIEGKAFVWNCDAVILATGGAPAMFRLHTNPPGQTGDGMAMVLRAGGELVDMEFMQMYPTALVFPPAAYGMEIATGRLLAAGGRLFNRHGEEFFQRWEKGPVGQATRDTLARAIAREIAAGGGTDAGGVYFDGRHVPELGEQDRHVKFLQDLGVDPARGVVQVAPGAHYSLGGVRAKAPTSCVGLSGLFAAGEVMGGLHGANRLAGNALSETQVFGALAGREAIEYLKHQLREGGSKDRRGKEPESKKRPAARGESRVWDVLCDARARTGGEEIGSLHKALRDVVQECGGMVRTGAGLEKGLARVRNLRQAFVERLSLPDLSDKWHPGLLKAAEMANMLEAAQALLASALARTESRGAHFRDDHPKMDPGFHGHNFVVRGEGEKTAVYRLVRDRKERRKVWP